MFIGISMVDNETENKMYEQLDKVDEYLTKEHLLFDANLELQKIIANAQITIGIFITLFAFSLGVVVSQINIILQHNLIFITSLIFSIIFGLLTFAFITKYIKDVKKKQDYMKKIRDERTSRIIKSGLERLEKNKGKK